nr:MBL fold metallo-hydrolase [Pseudenhygromyxa sp. WMMC2535]
MISHGHGDHMGGIHYWISQRGMMNLPPGIIHLPAEIAPAVESLMHTWSSIEGFDYRYELRPASPGDRVPVGRKLSATAVRTHHRVPSLAWVIERRVDKLLPELRGLPGEEIHARRKRGEAVTESREVPILCVTGDTTIDTFLENELVRRCQVLVHECTSWSDERSPASTREWGHTHVDELIEHAEKFEGEALVLVHRSLRHSKHFAQEVVRRRFPAHLREKVFVFGE